MSVKMPNSVRSEIITHSRRNKWAVQLNVSGADRFDKLITLNSEGNRRTIYIDKVTGFSKSGAVLKFKVAVHPRDYRVEHEALPGVSAAINQQSRKNLHSHSGYQGCPKYAEHNEPCAMAYNAVDMVSLKLLIEKLNCD